MENYKSNYTKGLQTKKNIPAPIIVFAYNRADKLERLLKSVERNKNIEFMDLYIFVDIPDIKNKRDIKYNQQVMDFLERYNKECKKFKSVQIRIADKHKGLALSIISGVTEIINKFGKAIVLEDDLEVSVDFLDYMQRGLDFYENNKKVWSLSGYSPVFDIPNKYKQDVFLIPRPESWGWGTWRDRWNRCDWSVKTYNKFCKDFMAQMLFNVGGDDLGIMLKRQMEDEGYNSWAIRWGYHQFLERKYTVYPVESRVIHCGNDNRSTHGAYFDEQKLKRNYKPCSFTDLKINCKMISRFRKIYKVSFKEKMISLFF